MNRIFIRKEYVSRIYIKTKEKNSLYKNHKINELKIFGFILIKAKKYFTALGYRISNDEISKNNYIENNIVYIKPYIKFYSKKNISNTLYFENEDNLYGWLDENFKDYTEFLELKNIVM